MRWRIGTSGYSYREWKGPFYPADLPQKRWLEYYATQLDAVEINNTFYRMPKSEVMERWAGEVGDDFTFVLKASQRITHHARLKDVEEPVGYLWSAAQHLGQHCGPILFQLPPFAHKDIERLRTFLGALPDGLRAVLEFRHDSWNDDEVVALLAEHGAALCSADTDDGLDAPALLATAPFGYVRLRREDYDDERLKAWIERIRAQDWQDVYVFFKHEDAGAGPKLAARLRQLVDA